MKKDNDEAIREKVKRELERLINLGVVEVMPPDDECSEYRYRLVEDQKTNVKTDLL